VIDLIPFDRAVVCENCQQVSALNNYLCRLRINRHSFTEHHNKAFRVCTVLID
jgi:hypothetical protein